MANKKKTWIEARIEGAGVALDAVSNFAFEIGAAGLEETADGVSIFFPSGTSGQAIENPLSEFVRSLRSMGHAIADPVLHPVQEEDWGRAWKENFKPIRVGNRIVVKPPWETRPGGTHDIVIDISPKMAFGTGSHETTRLCLEMLERFVESGMSVLDVGTGSGILAIAAVKLGASRADAVDVEEESVENAHENFRLNRVEDRTTVRLGSLDVLAPEPYGMILANIDRKTLTPMLPKFSSYGRPGTVLVLSGILAEEKQPIIGLLARSRFRLIESPEIGEWAGFAAVFKNMEHGSPRIKADKKLI
jgi:ribosomal protein L11 methyltransferase